jgi:hypothetical protein
MKLDGNTITDNGTYEVPVLRGYRYVFAISGEFGGGSVSVSWLNSTGGAILFGGGNFTGDGTFEFAAPTDRVALVVTDTVSPVLEVAVSLIPLSHDSVTNPNVVAAIADDPAAVRAAAQVDARGGRNVSVVLGTNEAGNENTVTLKTSATLTIPLEVGTWDVEAGIVVDCNNLTAGSRQKLHFTGTYSSFLGAVYGTDNGSVSSSGYPSARATGVAVDYERFATGSSIATLRVGRIVVTAAGNITAQFAQRTATAGTSPTLVAGSYIRAIKVA